MLDMWVNVAFTMILISEVSWGINKEFGTVAKDVLFVDVSYAGHF